MDSNGDWKTVEDVQKVVEVAKAIIRAQKINEELYKIRYGQDYSCDHKKYPAFMYKLEEDGKLKLPNEK